MDGVSLIEELNKIAGANGIGRIDLVENRLVGIKSREVYEAPAAVTLHFAHTELERLTLDKEVFHYKSKLSDDYATLIYNGLWFSPLKKAMDGFINETQRNVTGLVKVRMYKGNLTVGGGHPAIPSTTRNSQHIPLTIHSTIPGSRRFYQDLRITLKTFHKVNSQMKEERKSC